MGPYLLISILLESPYFAHIISNTKHSFPMYNLDKDYDFYTVDKIDMYMKMGHVLLHQ